MNPNDNSVADNLAQNIAYLIGHIRNEIAYKHPELKPAIEVIDGEALYLARHGDDMLGQTAKNLVDVLYDSESYDKNFLEKIKEG